MKTSNVLLLVLCFCFVVQLAQSALSVNSKVDGILSVDVHVPSIEAAAVASAGAESRKKSQKDGTTVVENHDDHKP